MRSAYCLRMRSRTAAASRLSPGSGVANRTRKQLGGVSEQAERLVLRHPSGPAAPPSLALLAGRGEVGVVGGAETDRWEGVVPGRALLSGWQSVRGLTQDIEGSACRVAINHTGPDDSAVQCPSWGCICRAGIRAGEGRGEPVASHLRASREPPGARDPALSWTRSRRSAATIRRKRASAAPSFAPQGKDRREIAKPSGRPLGHA